MFQVQHVFKVKLALFSFKNPKLLMLETHGHENGQFSKQALQVSLKVESCKYVLKVSRNVTLSSCFAFLN